MTAQLPCAGKKTPPHTMKFTDKHEAQTAVQHSVATPHHVEKQVGPVASFYKNHGTLFDLHMLLEAVLAGFKELDSSFFRQFFDAVAHHSLRAATHIFINLNCATPLKIFLARSFTECKARGPESTIQDFYSVKPLRRAQIVMLNIAVGSAHNRAAIAQLSFQKVRHSKQLRSGEKSSLDYIVDILEYAKNNNIPMSFKTGIQAIMVFAVPLEHQYTGRFVSTRMVWDAIHCLLGHVEAHKPSEIAQMGTSLIRVFGQTSNSPDVIWSIVKCMYVLGVSHTTKGKTSRSIKLSCRRQCERRTWPDLQQANKLYLHQFSRTLVREYDDVDAPPAKAVCMSLRQFMNHCSGISSTFGTPLHRQSE